MVAIRVARGPEGQAIADASARRDLAHLRNGASSAMTGRIGLAPSWGAPP
jgi:hypothetical protein